MNTCTSARPETVLVSVLLIEVNVWPNADLATVTRGPISVFLFILWHTIIYLISSLSRGGGRGKKGGEGRRGGGGGGDRIKVGRKDK